MDKDRCTFDQCLIAFRWIFLGSVPEEAGTNGHSNPIEIVAAGENIVLVSVHDT
jgi:hypothetical protein